MLARLNGIKWESPAPQECTLHTPAQIDFNATAEWTHHCSKARNGIVGESFYYVFGEPAKTALLRIDLRPEDESPATTARLLPELRTALASRFGNPVQEPELMEIGFRHLRYGQPVAGDHWHNGGFHYFLHANQSNLTPLGMRRGVQLIVMTDRLHAERMQDGLILRSEGISGEAREGDDVVRARLRERAGAHYVRAMAANLTRLADHQRTVDETLGDLTSLLIDSQRAKGSQRALLLVAANGVTNRLAQNLTGNESGATSLRRLLAQFGVKLGGETHYGGLAYAHELLWHAWQDAPDTEGGELAFILLTRAGWDTQPGEGCPTNPDRFREVITRAEAFLSAHPRSDFRAEVTYMLAQAHESWWSIGRAANDDAFVSAPPYPHKAANAAAGERARDNAIRCYRELIALAPGTPAAASAQRRIPRLLVNLDTGQRRFFCSYC
jgi:hypothetical protein